jgi:hypothetical protein
MSYDIIVRFPNQKTADKFAGQMSDGIGENYCDFSHWRQKEGTDGKKQEDFEKVFEGGKRVYFVSEIFEE